MNPLINFSSVARLFTNTSDALINQTHKVIPILSEWKQTKVSLRVEENRKYGLKGK